MYKNSPSPIRIAQILGRMDGGGIEQVVMNYYRNIDKTKVQFDFYVFESSTLIPEDEINALGGRVYRLCGIKHPLRYIRALSSLLKDNECRIVHCHMGTLAGAALYAAKKADVPVRIIHNHTTAGGSRELVRNAAKALLKPFCYRDATIRLACSQYAAQWMYKNAPICGLTDDLCPKHSVLILPNAIDTGHFSYSEVKRNELRSELKLPANAVVYGHIGRFCPQKNQSFLLDIFAEIAKRQPEAVLLLVGSGKDLPEIQQKAADMDISSHVYFPGQRSDTDKLYSAFDCFLLPSNYEGLPVVGVEAQASGVSCIFSDRITREACISDYVRFLSLECGASAWADAAIDAAKTRNHSAHEQVCVHGFDIIRQAEMLTQLYLSLYDKEYYNDIGT